MGKKKIDLFAPITMAPSHAYRHLSDVGHLLSLEPVQISLDSRARIFEILSSQMKCVLKLDNLPLGTEMDGVEKQNGHVRYFLVFS